MRNKLISLIKSPHFILIFCSNIASLLNFGVNILLTRTLSPADSATFLAISSIPPIVYSIFSFVPYMISNTMLKDIEENNFKRISNLLYTHIFLTFSWSFILIILAKPISSVLQIEQIPIVACLFLILFFTAQINFLAGMLQVLEKFIFVGLKDISIAVIKLTSLSLLFFAFDLKNPWSPLLSEGIAIVITLIILIKMMWPYFESVAEIGSNIFSFKNIFNFFIESRFIIFGVSLIGLITSFDVLISKIFLTPNDAGYLIAASTFAKIVFFICGSVPMIVYILGAKHKFENDIRKSLKSLVFSFCVVFFIGAFVGTILHFNKSSFINNVYSSAYSPTTAIASYSIIYMLTISLNILLINFFMSQNYWRPLLYTSFLYLIFVIYISFTNHSLLNVTQNLTLFSFLNLASLIMLTASYFTRRLNTKKT